MFEVCRWKRKGISIDDDNNAMTFFLTRNSSHHHHNHCGCRFIFATIVAGGESSNRSNDNHFISLGHGNRFANFLLFVISSNKLQGRIEERFGVLRKNAKQFLLRKLFIRFSVLFVFQTAHHYHHPTATLLGSRMCYYTLYSEDEILNH